MKSFRSLGIIYLSVICLLSPAAIAPAVAEEEAPPVVVEGEIHGLLSFFPLRPPAHNR